MQCSVTVVNLIHDTATENDRPVCHVIPGCSWREKLDTSGGDPQRTVHIRLPPAAGYLPYFQWAKLPPGEKAAHWTLKRGGRAFQLPVAVDIEDKLQAALSKSALTDIVAHCLSVVESWGVYAMLYTGLYFGQNNLYMGGAALKSYDVWLAAYRTKKPAPDWAFGMWQYTSSGKIPGIAKGADLSVAYKDYAAIIQRAGLGQVRG